MSQRALSLALHGAAGIVLAVVAVELIPETLTVDPPWVPILAFIVGGAFFIGSTHLSGVSPGERGKLLGPTGPA